MSCFVPDIDTWNFASSITCIRFLSSRVTLFSEYPAFCPFMYRPYQFSPSSASMSGACAASSRGKISKPAISSVTFFIR